MASRKVRVTVHVSELFEEGYAPSQIPSCMDSSGCAGSKSQASQGSRSKAVTIPVYASSGDEPDVELQVISPLSDEEDESSGS